MATRRTKKRHSAHNDEPETVDHMIDRVVGAFDRWLTERLPDQQQRREVTGIVHTACEFKSSYLGESNPADWNPDLAVEVLGQVIPRKVVGVDEQYASALVPAMMTFIEFLVLTSRWKPHNDAAATRGALTALEPELPGRFTDPDRLTMAGRVMQVALDEGVDITEPGALAEFMQRFNAMPYEWRKRLTDASDTLDDPNAFGFAGMHDENDDDDLWDNEPWDEDDEPEMFDDPATLEILGTATAAGIAAVGFVGDATVSITVPDAPSELAALLATPLLTRMTALTEWVRPGRTLTSTMAMRRADTAEWARRFGVLTTADPTPRSMWDLPEVAAPWGIAAACGLINNLTKKARPGPNSDIFHSADLASQIRCAREAVDMLIDGLIDSGLEMSDLDIAVIGLLLVLLASLCQPEGADLSAFRSLARPGVDPTDVAESISRILFVIVLNIVDLLALWGFVTEHDGRSTVPPALRPAVVQAIYAPGAPFTIHLEPGAVPLDEPDDLDDSSE